MSTCCICRKNCYSKLPNGTTFEIIYCRKTVYFRQVEVVFKIFCLNLILNVFIVKFRVDIDSKTGQCDERCGKLRYFVKVALGSESCAKLSRAQQSNFPRCQYYGSLEDQINNFIAHSGCFVALCCSLDEISKWISLSDPYCLLLFPED